MAKNNIYAEIKLTDLASTLTFSYITGETTYTNIAVHSLAIGDFITTKGLGDSLFTEADITFNFNKSLSDSLDTTDLIRFSTQKFVTDSGTSSDTVSLSALKQFDDSTSTSDEINFLSTLSKADSASSIDSAPVFNFTKAILDTISVTDDLDGEIGIDDDQNILFTKKTSDSGALTDNSIKLVNKLSSENLGVSDTGSLYGQSYVDNRYYFVEDYVGYSQNF